MDLSNIPLSSLEAVELLRKYNKDKTTFSQHCSYHENVLIFRTDKVSFRGNDLSPLFSSGHSGEPYDLKHLMCICTHYIPNDAAQFLLDTFLSFGHELNIAPSDYENLHLFLTCQTKTFNGFDIDKIETYRNQIRNTQSKSSNSKSNSLSNNNNNNNNNNSNNIINQNNNNSTNNNINNNNINSDNNNNINKRNKDNKMDLDENDNGADGSEMMNEMDNLGGNSNEPAHKRRKLNNGMSYDQIDLTSDQVSHMTSDHTRRKSGYQVTGIESEADLKASMPFWQTLPMPNNKNKNKDDAEGEADSKLNEDDNDIFENSFTFRKFLREDGTRNTVLNSTNPRKDLSRKLGEFVKPGQLSEKVKAAVKNPEQIVLSSQKIRLSKEQKALNLRNEVPIIVVPSSLTSLISTANAKEFLQDQLFLKNTGDKLGTKLMITRPSKLDKDNFARFEIMNQPRMESKDWDRVAAVFVVGKKWQFRSWPPEWKGPEQIFSKVCGFYLHWADSPPTGDVARWRVINLGLSRVSKHDHARVANIFWNQLYTRLQSHKNKKLFW